MKTFLQAFLALAVLTLLTGVVYPLSVWIAAQVLWPEKATGSLVMEGAVVKGSELIAQSFQNDRYFFARPSASEFGAVPSSASQLGPTSAVLKNLIAKRRTSLALSHGVDEARVPVELITASASGLDPHISPSAAHFQVARVAKARALNAQQQAKLEALIAHHTQTAQWEMFGEARVNVLMLNRALDAL